MSPISAQESPATNGDRAKSYFSRATAALLLAAQHAIPAGLGDRELNLLALGLVHDFAGAFRREAQRDITCGDFAQLELADPRDRERVLGLLVGHLGLGFELVVRLLLADAVLIGQICGSSTRCYWLGVF